MGETFIDNSIAESVARCSTQCVMRYALGWTTVDGKVLANVGKAIHKGHESWFVKWDAAHALNAFSLSYSELVTEEEQAAMEPKDPCQFENVYETLQRYYETHPREFFPFETITEGVEEVFMSPLIDDIWYFGLVDMPVIEKKTGALYVCDHKNRFGYISDWWAKKFALTSQFTGYVWLVQKKYGGVCPGAYVNALSIKKLPDPVQSKCRVHKVPYAQCRLQHVDSSIFVTTRSVEAVQKWEQMMVGLARKYKALVKVYTDLEMVRHCPDEGRWTGACVFCEFRKWCRADRAASLVEGMFVQDRWEPWK